MARISIGTTISGTMMSSILVWMLTLPKNRGRFSQAWMTLLIHPLLLVHGGLLLAHRPVLLRHRGLGEVERCITYGTKSTALFTA